MNGVIWFALGLVVIATTPAVIVYVLMRGKAEGKQHVHDLRDKAWTTRNLELHGQIVRLEAENASLRERNGMLAGLVGADAERAALAGACADEAGWGA